MNSEVDEPAGRPADSDGDMVISGGNVRWVEDVPTKNIPEGEMEAFVLEHQQSAQEPPDESADATGETDAGPATPDSTDAPPPLTPAGPRPTNRRSATRRAGSTQRRPAEAPRRKYTTLEKLLVLITIVCVVGGVLNFTVFRRSSSTEPDQPTKPVERPESEDLKRWKKAQKLARQAKLDTLAARKLYQEDTAAGTEKYLAAASQWDEVFVIVNQIDWETEADKYWGYQDRMAEWGKFVHECGKFSIVDDFDYEAELQKAKERNRLEEERQLEDDEPEDQGPLEDDDIDHEDGE